MEIGIKHIMIFCAIWIVGAIAGFALKNRKQKITIKYKDNGDAFKKADPKFMAMPVVEREIKFNLVYSESTEIPEDLLCDFTIRLEEILAGTYKVPERFLKKQKDAFIKEPEEKIENIVPTMGFEDYGDLYTE